MKNVKKICPICEIEFIVPKSHQHRYITCGHKCGGIYRKKPIITNECLQCKNTFISKKSPTRKQDFCSVQCSSKSRIKNIERVCKCCNAVFYVVPYRLTVSGGGTYCSQKCRLEDWDRQSLAKQMPGSYRQNAWKVFEKKCYDCGIDDDRIIVIHHIDGDRKNGLLTNLIPVCHNCHCIRHIELSGNHRIPSYRGED